MKRDAQLTLRIPARLKEEIRDRAAKENRKPADAAVRILETNLKTTELIDAAKEALDVMPEGDKKDRLVLAILGAIGKTAALMLFFLWNGSSFGVSPEACVAMCKIMNQSKGGVTCSIYYVENVGGVLFLDFQTKTVKDVSPRTTLQWEGLRDAFIATGGSVEITDRSHKAPYRCFPGRDDDRVGGMVCRQVFEPTGDSIMAGSFRKEIHTSGSRLIAGVKL